MNTQSTVEQLQGLKLHGMSRLYQAVCEQPLHQQPEAHALMAMLADAESQYRLQQRTQLYLRLSKLRYQATVEGVKTGTERGLTKEQLLIFCDGLFIERGDNVLISGATGCSKSYPACVLGLPARLLYRLLCHEPLY